MAESIQQTGTNSGVTATHSTAFEKRTPRIREEVFWTELEIRRLSNFVAESIHSRRYIGNTEAATEERQQMRTYIDAMKRKAMRVLHRAELFARSGQPSWPGIDATIADPVSLADEYVKVVEDYLAVLSSEEERVRKEREEAAGAAAMADMAGDSEVAETARAAPEDGEEEDWVVADDVAYREALKREKEKEDGSEASKRDELLGPDAEGLRQRKGTTTDASDTDGNKNSGLSKGDEEVMERHQPIQDELTNNLVDLVGQLKESVTENKERMDKDKQAVDEVEDAVDRNVDSVSKQRSGLEKFSQSSSMSWWMMIAVVAVMLLVFVLILTLLAVPI